MNTVNCPHCQQGVENRADLSKQVVSCPHCRRQFQMPAYSPVPAFTPSSSRRVNRRPNSDGSATIIASVVVLGSVFACCGGCLMIGQGMPGGGGNQQPSRSSVMAAGENGRISVGSGDVIICRTVDSFNELTTLLNAKDEAGLERMAASSTAFAVSDGTRVKVLSPGIMRMEVSVQEGAYKGQRGYIYPEWVSR